MKIKVTNGKISKIETCCPMMAQIVCTQQIQLVVTNSLEPLKLRVPGNSPIPQCMPCVPPSVPCAPSPPLVGPPSAPIVIPPMNPPEEQTMNFCFKCGAKIQIVEQKFK